MLPKKYSLYWCLNKLGTTAWPMGPIKAQHHTDGGSCLTLVTHSLGTFLSICDLTTVSAKQKAGGGWCGWSQPSQGHPTVARSLPSDRDLLRTRRSLVKGEGRGDGSVGNVFTTCTWVLILRGHIEPNTATQTVRAPTERRQAERIPGTLWVS